MWSACAHRCLGTWSCHLTTRRKSTRARTSVSPSGFCANKTWLEQMTLICTISGADVVGMCSPMSWNMVVSPDNTTKVHISSCTSASHFMILWGEVSWNTLASLPLKSCWNNLSAQWNCSCIQPTVNMITRTVSSLYTSLRFDV